MINVIFCGYRTWAMKIFAEKYKNVNVVSVITSKEQFDQSINVFNPDAIDVIVFCGWSWIIKPEVYNSFLCVGIHPSDLPNYRGGSPIQHQIIDGIKETKISLITLADGDVDSGKIWLKEPVSFRGDSMNQVFDNIADSSIRLLNTFFDNFSNIVPHSQKINEGFSRKRRCPSDSKITCKMIEEWPFEKLYDFIRSLTDPYPNAYFENNNGERLYITGIKYIGLEGKEEK